MGRNLVFLSFFLCICHIGTASGTTPCIDFTDYTTCQEQGENYCRWEGNICLPNCYAINSSLDLGQEGTQLACAALPGCYWGGNTAQPCLPCPPGSFCPGGGAIYECPAPFTTTLVIDTTGAPVITPVASSSPYATSANDCYASVTCPTTPQTSTVYVKCGHWNSPYDENAKCWPSDYNDNLYETAWSQQYMNNNNQPILSKKRYTSWANFLTAPISNHAVPDGYHLDVRTLYPDPAYSNNVANGEWKEDRIAEIQCVSNLRPCSDFGPRQYDACDSYDYNNCPENSVCSSVSVANNTPPQDACAAVGGCRWVDGYDQNSNQLVGKCVSKCRHITLSGNDGICISGDLSDIGVGPTTMHCPSATNIITQNPNLKARYLTNPGIWDVSDCKCGHEDGGAPVEIEDKNCYGHYINEYDATTPAPRSINETIIFSETANPSTQKYYCGRCLKDTINSDTGVHTFYYANTNTSNIPNNFAPGQENGRVPNCIGMSSSISSSGYGRWRTGICNRAYLNPDPPLWTHDAEICKHDPETMTCPVGQTTKYIAVVIRDHSIDNYDYIAYGENDERFDSTTVCQYSYTTKFTDSAGNFYFGHPTGSDHYVDNAGQGDWIFGSDLGHQNNGWTVNWPPTDP